MNTQMRRVELESLIQEEELKLESWKAENERRRFNYFPFIHQLLLGLGREGELEGMIEKGRERTKERREAAKKLKEERAKQKS